MMKDAQMSAALYNFDCIRKTVVTDASFVAMLLRPHPIQNLDLVTLWKIKSSACVASSAR